MDLGLLYKALEQGQVTMIAANATDGPLASPDLTVLEDDKKTFGSYQACIMVRQDMLADEPRLKPALDELAGKFTNAVMRKLDAAVDIDHRQPAAVAAEFLAQAGLK
jgi:osmoprotectant transport system substrate-binding protein